MAIKVNEFVIQAKVIEEGQVAQRSEAGSSSSSSAGMSDSIKKEILDEVKIEMRRLVREELESRRVC